MDWKDKKLWIVVSVVVCLLLFWISLPNILSKGQEQIDKMKFESLCSQWIKSGCGNWMNELYYNVSDSYKEWKGEYKDFKELAKICGCPEGEILESNENYQITKELDGLRIQIFSKVLSKNFSEYIVNGWMESNTGILNKSINNGIIIHSTSCCQGNHKSYPYFIYLINPDKEPINYIPIPKNITTYSGKLLEPKLNLTEEYENYKVYSYDEEYYLGGIGGGGVQGKIVTWRENDKEFLISSGYEAGFTGAPSITREYIKNQ